MKMLGDQSKVPNFPEDVPLFDIAPQKVKELWDGLLKQKVPGEMPTTGNEAPAEGSYTYKNLKNNMERALVILRFAYKQSNDKRDPGDENDQESEDQQIVEDDNPEDRVIHEIHELFLKDWQEKYAKNQASLKDRGKYYLETM